MEREDQLVQKETLGLQVSVGSLATRVLLQSKSAFPVRGALKDHRESMGREGAEGN